MLTGKELGQAIEAARLKKGVSKRAMAEHFNIAPPSVSGWISTGRIDKAKLADLFSYFSDVAGPEHWGLQGQEEWLYRDNSANNNSPHEVGEQRTQYSDKSTLISAAAALMGRVTPRSQAVAERILALDADGKLTPDDLEAIAQIVERFGANR